MQSKAFLNRGNIQTVNVKKLLLQELVIST